MLDTSQRLLYKSGTHSINVDWNVQWCFFQPTNQAAGFLLQPFTLLPIYIMLWTQRSCEEIIAKIWSKKKKILLSRLLSHSFTDEFLNFSIIYVLCSKPRHQENKNPLQEWLSFSSSVENGCLYAKYCSSYWCCSLSVHRTAESSEITTSECNIAL